MSFNITRRHALGALLASGTAACTPKGPEILNSARTPVTGTFAHGIASGDPEQTRVILWTRITPEDPRVASVEVNWEVSKQDDFSDIVAKGTFPTSAVRNWTVKVDASGLRPGTWYFYRFKIGDAASPVGRTRTLPEDNTKSVRFAVVSCANWQQGYFNVYDHIAREQAQTKQPFDALLHLGDYIYEYSADKVASTEMAAKGRLHEPRHEIVSLEDYRIRHAQYRSDPALQALTAQMPMIAIWDDHESSNDSWKDGAENHTTETEGDWQARKEAAMRAYYEWMPVRDPKPGRGREFLFRKFEWGDLATLCAVETRLLARGAPIIIEEYYDLLKQDGGLEIFNQDILSDPSRDMLGSLQTNWIAEQFKQSKNDGKLWRVLANQVVMGRLQTPDLTPHVDEDAISAIEAEWAGIRDFVNLSAFGLPVYPDSWDGYPAARQQLYTALDKAGINDMLVLTGDAHEFWVNDLTDDNGAKMGAEVGTSSVSSETLAAFLGDGAPDYALLVTQTNPDVRYYNPLTSGYVDLTLSRQKAKVRLVGVNTVTETTYSAFEAANFSIVQRGGSLKVTDPNGLNLKQRALFHGIGD